MQKNVGGATNMALAVAVGIVLAILFVGITVVTVGMIGPIVYACFVLPLVAGVFYFTRARHPVIAGIDIAVVFFALTFVYVIILAGGIGLGFFGLR